MGLDPVTKGESVKTWDPTPWWNTALMIRPCPWDLMRQRCISIGVGEYVVIGKVGGSMTEQRTGEGKKGARGVR